jgi:ubiquinone/menaquinone biosynthesis C-methylase UbiE
LTINQRIAYHLRELEIARDPYSPAHLMPRFSAEYQRILDIGSGIGQTFAASGLEPSPLLVALDVDLESLRYGRSEFGEISFVAAAAERLPFRDGVFDLAISRLSLPYTDILWSLTEVIRTLRANGGVWFALHSFGTVRSHLVRSLARRKWRDVFYRSYVILNGLCFNLTGRLFTFPFDEERRVESFQSVAGMRRALERAGFVDVWVARKNQHMICTARKKAG